MYDVVSFKNVQMRNRKIRIYTDIKDDAIINEKQEN
jgi:hypothetical protein